MHSDVSHTQLKSAVQGAVDGAGAVSTGIRQKSADGVTKICSRSYAQLVAAKNSIVVTTGAGSGASFAKCAA